MVSFHGGGWATGSGNAPGLRRRPARPLRRRGGRDGQPPPGRLRLPEPGRPAGAPAEFAYAGVCGVMDMVASLRMGARQHRRFRRRSRPGDDLRPVGRRREDLDAAGDARGQGPLPPRRRAVRLDAAPADAARRAPRRAEALLGDARHPEDARRRHAEGVLAGPAGSAAARRRGHGGDFCAGARRRRPAAPPLRPGRAGGIGATCR